MKQNGMNALIVTANALSVTSQLLAIGIEIGIIIGGYCLFKKAKEELLAEEPQPTIPVEESKPTFKQKLEKVKKIFHAVVS